MSWQSAFACWLLRRHFRPQTRRPAIDVRRARVLSSRRLYSPAVPAGWVLREQYGEHDWPLKGEWLTPKYAAPAATILYLHGGGYYFCTPRTHRAATFGLATRSGARVFSLDYRLAPEHPFPAALDDALNAWRHLRDMGTPARSIVIAGDSAGGGLALAMLVALRDAGDTLPAGAVLFSPWTDLAATGASLQTNDGIDPMFHAPSVAQAAKLYLGDAPATHPYASPVYAEMAGLPPLLVQVGSTEVLLDDSRRVVDKGRAAGVSVEFDVWHKMPHVWQLWAPFIPEARRALDVAGRFIRDVTSARDAAHPPGETSIVR